MRITIIFLMFMAINGISWGQLQQNQDKYPNNKSTYHGFFEFMYGSENYTIEFQSSQNVFTITKNGVFNCSGEFIKVGDAVFQLTPTQTAQDAVIVSIVRFKTESIQSNVFNVVVQEINAETTQNLTLMKI